MKVTVAPNARARVHLPAMPGAKIRESGHDITASPDVRPVASDGNAVILEVGSGNYHFTVSAA
jgi:alpha-L-rhamnosidase